MNEKKVSFAGGCFWCMESPFEGIEGVIDVVSGYTGGPEIDPTYEAVASGQTGHFEAIQVSFDPERVSYDTLLDTFWKQIDPTDGGGSFVDRGHHYQSAIFFEDDMQEKQARASKKALEASGPFADQKIATQILPAGTFYLAEDYHQDFHKKNPTHYQRYRQGSGRDLFIEKTWCELKPPQQKEEAFEKPDVDCLKKSLSPLQFKVTQEDGTEAPFSNDYWDNKEEGLYVDVVSGEVLFSSKDKFDSGTGWPSFTQTAQPDGVTEKIDGSLTMQRTEVRSKKADSHLGHLFPDGPGPAGMRYCINSASLRFIGKDELEKEGYGAYLDGFE